MRPHQPGAGIPVRRLPDEVLHSAACRSHCAANGCASDAVFYTGGALGSGRYALKGELRVTDAVAVAGGPLSSAGRVTVLRRLPSGQQLNIRVDVNDALRDPRANIPVWPGDTLILHGCGCRAFSHFFRCGLKSGSCAAEPRPSGSDRYTS